jgi:putative membrane protein
MVYWSFWGMHLFWWLFWALMVVLFFTAIAPASRSRARFEDDPDTILRRRYARGELSTAEYEERLVVLRRTYPERAPLEREAEPRSREPTPPPGATPVPSAT